MAFPKGKSQKEDVQEIRIVMIGKTEAAESVTTDCAFGKQEVTSRSRKYNLKVIDTPGLKDNRVPEKETCGELVKCLSLVLPGPQFFIIVVQIGRFTDEDLDVVQLLKREFGDELMNFALVVFTHGSKLDGKSIEEYLKTAPPTLLKVIEESQNRYAVIYDKRHKNFQKSVQNIIDLIVSSIELRYYTNDMFKQADANKKKIVAQLEEEKNREIKALKEELEELKRREGEKCSKEEKKEIVKEKQKKEAELKKTETTSSEEKYDNQVLTDNSVAPKTFGGIAGVGGLVTTGVGLLTGNVPAITLGLGMLSDWWK